MRRDVLSGRIVGQDAKAAAYAELWSRYVQFYIDKAEVQDFLLMDDAMLRKTTAQKRGKVILTLASGVTGC